MTRDTYFYSPFPLWYINFNNIKKRHYRFISSWTHPCYGVSSQWSSCAGLGCEDPEVVGYSVTSHSPQLTAELHWAHFQTAIQNLDAFSILCILSGLLDPWWMPHRGFPHSTSQSSWWDQCLLSSSPHSNVFILHPCNEVKAEATCQCGCEMLEKFVAASQGLLKTWRWQE